MENQIEKCYIYIDSRTMNIEKRVEKIESEILEIQERNKRVEDNKAWETSLFRKVAIVVITYLIAVIVLWTIKVSQPMFNALIPTIGFYLSTISIPFLKKQWLKKRNSQKLN